MLIKTIINAGKQYSSVIKELEVLDNGLLILVIVLASVFCSLVLTLTNKKKSNIIWLMKWSIVILLYPHKYIQEDFIPNIPFNSFTQNPLPIMCTTLIILIYDLISGTKRGRKVSKKFRILPKLIPLDEYKEKEQVDGTSRQITNEIIENEHDILEELVGNLSNSKLNEFGEDDGEDFSNVKETMPLANQNFPEIGGENKIAEENQEYCGNCNEPVKSEWKACPFCGEFLEILE